MLELIIYSDNMLSKTFDENIINDVIKDIYGTEGLDWVEWWTYEKSNNPELKAFVTNENGEDIEIRTIDDLYNYLEQNCIQI